jgi:phospholipase/carboxylesterase
MKKATVWSSVGTSKSTRRADDLSIMKTIDSTLIHRVLPPESSGGGVHPALIFLHGRGTDEEDLLGLTSAFDERLFVISARAPFPYEYGGFTWYDAGAVGEPDTVRFPESCNRLSQFITDVKAQYPVKQDKLFLFGFSMGCVMSFAHALSHPGSVRGVSANSGYVPEGSPLQFAWQELGGTAFHITHGTFDPVIPISFARRTRSLFEHSNASFTYKEYPSEHTLPEECIQDTAAWLRGLIDAP